MISSVSLVLTRFSLQAKGIVLPTQWNSSWQKQQRTAFVNKAMKWDLAAIAAHNHSLGARRYSPSPLPHALTTCHCCLPLAHMHHCYLTRDLTMCHCCLILAHMHHCCLTLALITAASLLLPHYCCLTTATPLCVISLQLSHCLPMTVTAKKPRSSLMLRHKPQHHQR